MENKVQVQDHSQEILSVIRSNASPGILRNKLEDYHENDLADIFPELTLAERRKICRILDTDMLSDIFEHIDQKQAAEYLDEMDVKKAAAILSAMETDAVVDVLKMTSKEKRSLLTELLDDDAKKDIAVIAAFDEDEIGSWMTTNCIVIRENLTVKQAMSSLVEQAAKNDNISTIFMVTEDQTFYGAMDLKDLIIARQDSALEDLIVTSYPYVYGHELIDDCIEKLKDYSEDSIPVLNNNNKLIGNSRKNILQRLRQNNIPQVLYLGKPQRTGCLCLSSVNGLDTGADNLAQISAGVHAQSHNAREKPVKFNKSKHLKSRKVNDAEHTIINNKYLNNYGSGTKNFHIGCCQKCQRIKTADSCKKAFLLLMAVLIKTKSPERAYIGHPHQRQNQRDTETNHYGK